MATELMLPSSILDAFIESWSLAMERWSEREQKQWEAEMYADYLASQ